MAVQDIDRLAVGHIPQAYGLIRTGAGQNRTVRIERDGTHEIRMSLTRMA